MNGTKRLHEAFGKLDERRREIERSILADIEVLLTADTTGAESVTAHHLGTAAVPGVVSEDDATATHSGSGFTFTWFGIG